MKFCPLCMFSILSILACDTDEKMVATDSQSIFDLLATEYDLMPEGLVSQSLDNRVYAQYVSPTDRYMHGVLGDRIEAEGLVVVVDGVFYELQLDNDEVFEGIRPRLYDVDGDGALEFITIRSNLATGAGIAIYKIIDDRLMEYATVAEIGTANRWLNIVAIDDLDNDGVVELVWIQTPHIGGILKVAKIKEGVLQILDETMQYSNHAIGERNLCLSVLANEFGQKLFYVPNQSRDKIASFIFENNALDLIEEIDLSVDFSQALISQFNFDNPITDEVNCIIGE